MLFVGGNDDESINLYEDFQFKYKILIVNYYIKVVGVISEGYQIIK